MFELHGLEWDVVLFSKTRFSGGSCILMDSHLLFASDLPTPCAGVSILLHQRHKHGVKYAKYVSDRLMYIDLLTNRGLIRIVTAYAPHAGLLLHMRRMQGTPLKTSRHFITNCRKFLRRDVGNDALLSLAVILIHSGKVAAAVNFWVRCVMRSNFVLQMKRTIGHSAVAWVWNDALILYFVPRVCNFWILGLHMRLT